jgi:FkbH-like protein
MDSKIKSAIKNCASSDILLNLVKDITPQELTPREIELIHHVVEKTNPVTEFNIAYLGNHTLDALARNVCVYCATQGLFVSSYIGAYNQHFQEVIDPDSALTGFKPDIIFLSLLMQELSPAIYASFLSLDNSAREQEIEKIISRINDWSNAARQNTDATLLISNFAQPTYPQAGVADLQSDYGESVFYSELNSRLFRLFRDDPRIFVFDIEKILSRYGKLRSYNPRMYHLAKMAWHEGVLPYLSDELYRYIRAIKGNARKCLALDLDNTLWGGVVGEDGIHGIRIGQGNAEGEAFLEFQRTILALKDRGIILAVCSKNNPEDVDEVFRVRKDMALSPDDFSVMQVNWEDKHINLQKIADELNIGTDSIVFMDDNPVECELIRQVLPEVKTVQLSGEPAEYADTLRKLADFEKLIITKEDAQKGTQYRGNVQRERKKSSVSNIHDFLESLGTNISIEAASQNTLPRVHQLFSKTNQFNTTTRRYSPADIESFINDPARELNTIHVRDNFGDMGIVGQYLVKLSGDIATIESFVISCRALGREIESFIMNKIKQDYLDCGRCSVINAQFIPTAKNKPAASFYGKQGFTLVETTDDGIRHYELKHTDSRAIACHGITMHMHEETI